MDKLLEISNKELVFVNEWYQANKLSLNICKTTYIIFKKNLSASIPPIATNNNVIKQVTSTKFLGLHINNNMDWKEHIGVVSQKISRAIGIIRRTRCKLSSKTSMLLYGSLILTQLTHCNITWAATYKTALTKLYILQKRALKLCI